jgi:hypothetical protein
LNTVEPKPKPALERDEPLGLTVHALPAVGLDDGHRTRLGRWKLLWVLLVCASPVIASYLTYFVIRPEGRTNYATLISPTRAWPAFAMTDLKGAPVSARDLRGQWILLAVGPSACDVNCEDRLFMQRQLREMTGRERERLDKVWLVLDEGPIKPELEQALMSTPAMRIMRADAAAVAAWLQPEPGAALGDHLYVIDPMGEWMMRTPVKTEPAKFKKDLERLLRASQFWDQAGRPQGQ